MMIADMAPQQLDLGEGMDQGTDSAIDQQQQDDGTGPGIAPEPSPEDPATAAITAVLTIPGPDAIRQVYQLAAAAARAKTQLQAAGSTLDARAYHGVLSRSPEARYVAELVGARRELDALAGERRRLNLEADRGRQLGRADRASLYEVQSSQVTAAMEQVALGTLLFLALPPGALDDVHGRGPGDPTTPPNDQLPTTEAP